MTFSKTVKRERKAYRDTLSPIEAAEYLALMERLHRYVTADWHGGPRVKNRSKRHRRKHG